MQCRHYIASLNVKDVTAYSSDCSPHNGDMLQFQNNSTSIAACQDLYSLVVDIWLKMPPKALIEFFSGWENIYFLESKMLTGFRWNKIHLSLLVQYQKETFEMLLWCLHNRRTEYIFSFKALSAVKLSVFVFSIENMGQIYRNCRVLLSSNDLGFIIWLNINF